MALHVTTSGARRMLTLQQPKRQKLIEVKPVAKPATNQVSW